jgi:hypothetical protein
MAHGQAFEPLQVCPQMPWQITLVTNHSAAIHSDD